MRQSLQKKLLFSYMAVIVALLILVSVGVSVLIRDYFVLSKKQELLNKGQELVRIVEEYSQGKLTDAQLVAYVNSVDSFLDARVWVVDAAGRVVAISTPPRLQNHHMRGPMGHGMMGGREPGKGQAMPSAGMLRSVLDEMAPVFQGQEWTRIFEHPFYNEQMLMAAVPLRNSDGSVAGAVLLHAPIQSINEYMYRIYLYIGVIGLVAILLALAITTWLSRGIVRPLRQMQLIAGAMARGDYQTRVSVTSEDEVGELGKSLNSLAQDLAHFVRQTEMVEKLRRDFVANVSHELRTPLTIIKGYNEAMLDEAVTDPVTIKKYQHLIREESERLERLIYDLLDLSRLQSGHRQELEPIPLAELAEAAAAKFRGQATAKGITLSVETEAVMVAGNGDRLTQLIVILMDNALKFTPAGGSIRLVVKEVPTGAQLSITDSGVGIPTEDLPYIWERFYKVDKAHSRTESGTGLGLAIAKEIIELHQGTVVVNSRPNEGTVFTVSFPAEDRLVKS
ncbi:hypothetical protein AXX12_15780 [Anaerosporomusa subterranea]|uniref:histidine kinase n=1 Tax=Anaerosporomusa subterranea TaxID=1794912 RepID=A0A154BMD1_ANASB|nr:ATP-binding protein [Anaerosporomusa subterranea]KYZ75035.1 hypothetical protein AXX12_15780 [Anaerosporomusa subterranea]